MSWPVQVADNMRLLKAAGYSFDDSWRTTLELFPMRFRYGAPTGVLFDADGSACDSGVDEFMRERCRESWFGDRPELVEVAETVSDVFGFGRDDRSARGRSTRPPLAA